MSPLSHKPDHATLRVLEHLGPTEWTWEFEDAQQRLRRKVALDPQDPNDQILLERGALAERVPGVKVRSELTRQLINLIGEDLATCLAKTAASRLYVSGSRASQVPLTLPFELLFRPHTHGPVVRVVSRARRPVPHSPSFDASGRVVAAFALREEDQYLPLHAEGATLAAVAERTGVPYDELFVTFTAEELLHLSRDAEVVHLAGHGRDGAMACYWPEGTEGKTLSSSEFIEAWESRAPGLVVLNFCESSSESDLLGLIEATHRGGTSLHEHSTRMVSPLSKASSLSPVAAHRCSASRAWPAKKNSPPGATPSKPPV